MNESEAFSNREHNGPAMPLIDEDTITDIYDDRTYDDAEVVKW